MIRLIWEEGTFPRSKVRFPPACDWFLEWPNGRRTAKYAEERHAHGDPDAGSRIRDQLVEAVSMLCRRQKIEVQRYRAIVGVL
jgi:hypothetical protein